MAKRLTVDVALRTALQAYSQRGLAKKIDVSPRTIGRWLRGESKPRDIKSAIQSLRPIYRQVQRKISRENKRADVEPVKTAIPVVGERRDLVKRDEYGDDTGERVPSDWVNFDVTYLDLPAVFDVLRAIRDSGPYVIQIIYRVRAGQVSAYTRTVSDRTYNEATGLIEVYPEMTDAELWEETLARLVSFGAKILFIARLDQ